MDAYSLKQTLKRNDHASTVAIGKTSIPSPSPNPPVQSHIKLPIFLQLQQIQALVQLPVISVPIFFVPLHRFEQLDLEEVSGYQYSHRTLYLLLAPPHCLPRSNPHIPMLSMKLILGFIKSEKAAREG